MKIKVDELSVKNRMKRKIIRSAQECDPHCKHMAFIGKGNVKFQGIHICLKCHQIWKLRHKEWVFIADNINEFFKGLLISRFKQMILPVLHSLEEER